MRAYLDCYSGISGDMLLGALLDAGLPLEQLRAGLATLPLTGYTLEAEAVVDHGISGTRAHVRLDADAPTVTRHLADVEALLAAAALPEPVRARASAIFQRLAEAEAKIHGTSIAEVHFHEVGAVDAIVDITGVALGLELLGVSEIYCSKLPMTTGRVTSAHGIMPVPAPATAELLRGTGSVWHAVALEGELVTPTGAAIVATLARFDRPTLTVRHIGYGFGHRQLPWANCLRLMIGDAPETAAHPDERALLERDEVLLLETNFDTMTGEALGWLMERLLAAGALDVSYAPLQMKKNRPATLLRVLARPSDGERLATLLLRESATLGVRMQRMERILAGRREEEIETPLGRVRIKVKLVAGQPVSVSPEYEDCRALAERHGLALEAVVARVSAAARRHVGLAE